ncbi:MAG: cytochrome P450 [Actinomycetota bacterium]
MAAVFFNPLQEGYADDPWSHFAEMREADPVHALLTGGYALFRYDDVFTLLRDPEMSVDDRNADLTALDRGELLAEFEDYMEFESILGMDPPDHTRLRRLISKAFTPRTIEGLRPRIEAMVDDALDLMAEAGTADVVGELAFPLPFDVISEMLGLPEADKNQIRDWSGAIVKTLDPVISDEEMLEAFHANRNLDGYLAEVIEWKRANPADDILTAMIEAEEEGDRMSSKELRDQVNLLFVAGHETTVNLIGTGIWELLKDPDQAAILREDPSLDATAVDEMLRWVSPVQFSRRITLQDIEVSGVTIPANTFVQTALGSANHDPAKFGPTAEQLDVRRTDAGQHVSFGSGIHYCLGASLAKLEGQVAIGRFLRRFPDAGIEDTAWNGRINLRGLDQLKVAVS